MSRYLACSLLFAAAAVTPAQAQAQPQPGRWSHEESGISLPLKIDEMQRGRERDLSGGLRHDVMTQYGSDTEPVTVYVYRSAYPNPALWFERTRHAMKTNVGLPTEGVAPRSFSLAGATAPNGLREEASLPPGGPWKSTAVAIGQVGEWVVKARITSRTLDAAGVAAKMDRLLASVQSAKAVENTLPLQVPGACRDQLRLKGKPIRRKRDKAIAAASVTGLAELTNARGAGGLARDPSAWCRLDTSIPAHIASVYRSNDGRSWVALLGDSGIAAAGHAFLEGIGADGAATYLSTASSTRVVALFDGLPNPDDAVMAVLPVLAGEAPALAEISVQPAAE